jgi:protein O-mannosyl-transferase
MFNKINITTEKKKLIVCIVLTIVTLTAYCQVNQFDFLNLDDYVYVTENGHIQSGITPDGIRWAFSTTYAEFWHPLTWLSLMFDYQFHGLNAGGYHLTNLILHILSTLLLFRLFCSMTGAVWKSAFVAALFALHPLHVEPVSMIAERKDVLSAFFWMLTLCLYVSYTQKPVIRRYLLVVFLFVCGLMSKPMLVTLPVIMILLDYWPLKRFESWKGNVILWQLKEKTPFFILSAVFSILTIYAQRRMFTNDFSIGSRFANAPVAFVTYLGKTFWPHDMAVFYPFSDQLPFWQVLGSALLIVVISIIVILVWKRLPYLFVGWLWYAVTLLPVIGIIRSTTHSMRDNYAYLPSIGIYIGIAWGIPLLMKREDMHKKILFPAGIAALVILSVLTWKQCGYWKNSTVLFTHTLQVTSNNYLIHNCLGIALFTEGKIYEAIDHYNEAIRINSYFAEAYSNRGNAYTRLGRYQRAFEDFNEAIRLQSNNVDAYNNRAIVYFLQGKTENGCRDARKACELGNCRILKFAVNRRDCH